MINKDLIYYQITIENSYRFHYLKERNVINIKDKFKTLKEAQNYLYEYLKDFIKNHSNWNKPLYDKDFGNIWDNMLFDCYNRVEYTIYKKIKGFNETFKDAFGVFKLSEEDSLKAGYFIIDASEYEYDSEFKYDNYSCSQLHILNGMIIKEKEIYINCY